MKLEQLYDPAVILAFRATAIPDATGYLDSISPDASCKTDAARSENIAKKIDKLAPELPVTRFFGRLLEVRVAAPMLGQAQTWSASDTGDVSVGTKLLQWLQEVYAGFLPCGPGARNSRPNLVFFGFGIDELIQLACIEALQDGKVDVPLGLWYHSSIAMPDHLVDMHRVLLPTSVRDKVSWTSFCRLVGVTGPMPGEDLQADLATCLQLMHRYQLYPRAIPLLRGSEQE